ncbi:MAG: PepSY domain-containing protein, partial [Pseudomonadota bacterium]|nr:PepSY domain-containing protein [Pseudomonadota bacterium]
VNQPGAVSIDKAIEIANAHNSSHIESIELEHKRGLTYYEVEYIDGSQMRRLLIDAASGEAIPSINRK